MKEETVEFRFNAKRIFLTYSQTLPRFTPDVVLKHLNKKAEKIAIINYLIGQETHADGGKHIHAYLKFETKLDTKNSRFLDLTYYGHNYHPYISKVTEVHKLWRYIKKENNYITNIDETRPMWQVFLEESPTKKIFLNNLLWFYGDENKYLQYRILSDLWKEKFKYRN